MRFLLDSDIIIAAMLGTSGSLRNHLGQCDEGDVTTSAVAYAKVAHGSMNGKAPQMTLLDLFFEEVPILPFDDAAARAFATLPSVSGSFYMLLAAHALSLELTIVTGNVRHFAAIPGLKVENWMLPT